MINRCVCFNKTFAEILVLAKKNGWSAQEIQENLKCGTKCKLCFPYIKDSLKSGRTQYGLDEKMK